MPEKQIQVVRDGVVLGSMTEAEARELLAIGLLKPGDQFHTGDSTRWRSLGELPPPALPPPTEGSWLRQAKRSLSSAGSAVLGTAGELVDKAKALAGTTRASAATVSEKLLAGFMPQIQGIVSNLAQTKPFRALRSGVNDDHLMLKISGAAYDCLPKPVGRFVSEQQFITFCMKHRAKLLQRESSKPDEPG